MAGNSNTINIALKLTDNGTVKAIQLVGTEAKKAGASGSKAFGDMDSSARKMGTGFESTTKTMSNHASSVTKSLGLMEKAMTALLAAMTAKELIAIADTWKLVEGRLKLVTNGTTELTSAQNQLFTIAQETRQSFEQTGDLYARVARSTKELHLSQTQLLGIVDSINKSLVISGASAQAADAALMQLGQGFAAGALRGEELNSVLEQAPRLAEAIAESMRVSVGSLKDVAAEGKITSKVLVDALSKGSDSAKRLSAEFDQMETTVGQAAVTVKNALMRMIGEFDHATGSSAKLADAFSMIAEHMDDIADAATIAVIGSIPVALVQIATAAPKAAVGIKMLTLAMMSNPWTAVATALAMAGVSLYQLRDSAREVANDGSMEGISAKIKQLETDLVELNELGRNPLLGKPYREEAAETEKAIAALKAQLEGLSGASEAIIDINRAALAAIKSFEGSYDSKLFAGIEKQYQATIDKELDNKIAATKASLDYYRQSEAAKPAIVAAMEKEISMLYAKAAKEAKDRNDAAVKAAEDRYDSELKALQDHNAKKYAEEIAAADNYADAWLIREQGMKDAAERAEAYQEEETQAAYDAEQDRLKDLEDALEEETRLREKAYEKSQNAYEDFSDTVQGYTADIIADWDNAGDMLVDIAKRTAAEMAAAFLAQQFIIPIGLSVGSAMGLSWNGTSMSSMLGVANGMAGTGSGFGLPGSSALNWAQSNIPGMGWLGTAIPGTTSAMTGAGASAGLLYPGGTSGVVPGSFAGVTWGSALGAGALGGLGYSLLGGSLGLPQNEWTGITSGLGSSGGFALGSSMSALGSAGGPLGALAGAVVGGLLGGLFGGSEKHTRSMVHSGSVTDYYSNPGHGEQNADGWDFFTWSKDMDNTAEDDLSDYWVKYYTDKLDAIDSAMEGSLHDVLAGVEWGHKLDPTDYDEDEIEQMVQDMSAGIFKGMRSALVSAVVGTDTGLFNDDFFKSITPEGGDVLDAFAGFVQTVEAFDDFESRVNDQLATGVDLTTAYTNLGIISDMMTLAETSIASMASSSTITALESLVDAQNTYIETMKEAGATMAELARVQTATAMELGASVTGLNANTLQSGILAAATSGTGITETIQSTIKSSMAAAIAGMAAENIMDAYIGGLNKQVGSAISDMINAGTMDAGSINSVFSDLFGAFDWDGMESSVSAAVEAINNMLGATDDLTDAEQALLDARAGAADDIQQLINDLLGGSGANVQSMEYFESRYEALYQAALSAQTAGGLTDAVSALTAFVPDYLDYAEAYGGGYSTMFDTIVGQLTALQAQMRVESEPTIFAPNTTVTVNVRIGDRELRDMIIDIIKNDSDAHNAINRVVA